MDDENEKFLEADIVYRDLFNLLEKIFRSKNLNIYDTFDNNVWFLASDKEFYPNKINSQTTPNTTINPENYNQMHHILESISANGSDFKKLKVNVSTFIRTFIIELIKIHKQTVKIGQKITSFNIDENVNVIDEKIAKIGYDSENNKSESFLKISLVKTENLPEGDYDCEIYVKKSKKNNLVDRGIVDNEIVVSSISSIKVTKRVHEFKDKDYSFAKFKIETVDINYNEFKPDEEILKIFSGTNLNSFFFELKNKSDGMVYKTKSEEFIELYLKLIDFFCDLTKMTNECILTLMMHPENSMKSSNKEIKLSISLIFAIDNNVRRYILLRIQYIFKLSISYRTMVESNLECLLKPFGSSVRENIKIMLERDQNEQKNECCGGRCLLI